METSSATPAGTTTAGEGTTGSPAGSSEGSSGSPGSSSDGGESSGSTGAAGFDAICEGDAEITISIDGVDQAHEGQRVWLSAVEPDNAGLHPAVVVLEDVITDGEFSLECAQGLNETFFYPSWTVVIDADDDGECSPGDVAFVHQLFGWATDQVYTFEASALLSHENDPPWVVTESAWQPVGETTGFNGQPLCDYFF